MHGSGVLGSGGIIPENTIEGQEPESGSMGKSIGFSSYGSAPRVRKPRSGLHKPKLHKPFKLGAATLHGNHLKGLSRRQIDSQFSFGKMAKSEPIVSIPNKKKAAIKTGVTGAIVGAGGVAIHYSAHDAYRTYMNDKAAYHAKVSDEFHNGERSVKTDDPDMPPHTVKSLNRGLAEFHARKAEQFYNKGAEAYKAVQRTPGARILRGVKSAARTLRIMKMSADELSDMIEQDLAKASTYVARESKNQDGSTQRELLGTAAGGVVGAAGVGALAERYKRKNYKTPGYLVDKGIHLQNELDKTTAAASTHDGLQHFYGKKASDYFKSYLDGIKNLPGKELKEKYGLYEHNNNLADYHAKKGADSWEKRTQLRRAIVDHHQEVGDIKSTSIRRHAIAGLAGGAIAGAALGYGVARLSKPKSGRVSKMSADELEKRFDSGKHPREYDGKFSAKHGEIFGRYAGGAAGSIPAFVYGLKHGEKVGGQLFSGGAKAYHNVVNMVRKPSLAERFSQETKEMNAKGLGRLTGHKHGGEIGGVVVGTGAAILGGLAGSGVDAVMRRRRAVKAGKLEQYERLNANTKSTPSSMKQLKASASHKVANAHQFVSQFSKMSRVELMKVLGDSGMGPSIGGQQGDLNLFSRALGARGFSQVPVAHVNPGNNFASGWHYPNGNPPSAPVADL